VLRRPNRLNFVIGALFIIAMGACGNLGGCGACSSSQPLPGGKLPGDQTVEGGAQIRMTQAGFTKLTSILPALLNDQFAGGFCVPRGQVGSLGTFGTGAEYCHTTANGCSPGCKVNVGINPNGLSVSVTNENTLRVQLSATVNSQIRVRGQLVGVSLGSCTLNVSSNNLNGNFDISLGIKPSDGELEVKLARINSFQLNMDFSGCGIFSDIANLASSIIDSFVGQFLIQLLTPAINDILQGIIPSPLGIAGMMDVGELLAGVSPGTNALMEARIVPGGYVRMKNNGMSLGVITGLNADEDISTREPGLASEPNLCVPPLPPPNFGAPPANLPITSRQTFALGVANEFDGVPEPAGSDLAMGVSETTLDLAGHHAVTSGMMCLGVGTQLVGQLNVGTIGILVPSVAELQSENNNDPLLLVTRPTRALDFTVGENTAASPALTIGISHLEVDFYAFLYERYTRVFTLDLSMNVGVNLEFEQPAGMPAVIKPSLVGISSEEVTITVLNSQFVRETPAELEAVLPSVFDLVTPLLGDLPAINVPSFAGFSLENLSIKKVVTQQDDFLSLNATLGAGTALRGIAADNRFAADVVRELDAQIPGRLPQSNARANLLRVTTPEPAKVRAALAKQPGGAMPEVVFDVDRFDSHGRELEWAYNLDGGIFRTYTSASPLVIADRAFAWQGKYTIGLKSRVKGDYRTVSETTLHPVTIDSVGPRLVSAEWDGDQYNVTLFDIVSGNLVHHAFGKPTSSEPESAWFEGGHAQLTRADLEPFVVDGEVALYAKDDAGNVSVALIAPFHGQPGEAGCNCDASGAPSPGGIVLALLVGIALVGRRRLRAALRTVARAPSGRAVVTIATWGGLSVALSLAPGCSCSKAQSCDVFSDCDECPEGEIAFCIDGTCVCSDDIVLGKLGPYSDVAAGPNGEIWVSAYHQQYGDLVVARVEGGAGRIPDEAWEWVDGVPDGPVVVPQSAFRNGISDKGIDVGMYTSIAVAPDGTPMVTYFDRDSGSLKFAARVGDVWQNHAIEVGTGELGETGALIGMYTSLSLRSDDGRPGVAYLAHVSDAQNGPRAEVRFASSQAPVPGAAADWMTWVVDTAPLPPEDPESPNIYPLPEGLGLFVDLARLPDQAPVVVYYDRSAGDLKVSKFSPTTGQFAAPVVLDGSGDLDAGWSPSVAVDPTGIVHVAYVNASNDDLMYVNDAAGTIAEIVDDGRRIVGTTVDMLPKPEYHFVGDDASLVLANAGTVPMIVYQDATTQELLLTAKLANGTWSRNSVAGATDPWPGGYGFFAADVLTGTEIVMSTWVIDQPNDDNWVEVFRRQTGIQ
jgi:MYXO-CTERM domain-containing protein